MRKISSLSFGLFISLLAVFLLGSVAWVWAADPAVLPPGLASAELVQEGTTVEGVLKNGETDNFKIELNAGYQLRAFGSAFKTGVSDSKLIINILNAKGEKLSTGQVISDGVANAESFFYKGLSQIDPVNPETVYVEVKSEGPADSGSKYLISFEKIDRSDVGTNADAGDQMTSALDLQLNNETVNFEKNFLGKNPCGSTEQSKYCSTDEKDVYTFSLISGKSINIQVVPSAKLNLTLTLLDQNNNTLKTAAGTSDGAIVEIDYTPPVAQQVYLEISSPAQSFFGSYSMKISQTSGVPPVSPTPVSATTPTSIPDQTPTATAVASGFDLWAYKNYLIIGGIVVVVVVVVWIVLSMMRKKRGQTSSAEIQRLHQSMKGGPAPVSTAPQQAKTAPVIGAARTMHSDLGRLPGSLSAVRPVVPPAHPNPSVTPRRSVGSAQPVFKPAVNRPAPVAADSDIGTFPHKAPAPNSLPTSSAPARPVTPSTPNRPTPSPRPPHSSGGTPAGTTAPPPPDKMDEKAKADIDQIFGA